MKKLKYYIIFFFIVLISLYSSFADLVDSDLLIYYSCNNNETDIPNNKVFDLQSFNQNMTISGVIINNLGLFNSSIEFGTNDDGRISADSQINSIKSDAFSFHTWYNTSYTGDAQTIIEKREINGDVCSATARVITIYCWDSGEIEFYAIQCDGTNKEYKSGNVGCNNGKWHSVGVFADNGNYNCYYDGVNIGNFTATNNIETNEEITIGVRKKNTGAEDDWLRGQIDEIYLSNRTLTHTEMVNLNDTSIYPYPLSVGASPPTPTLNLNSNLINPTYNYSLSYLDISYNGTITHTNEFMNCSIYHNSTLINTTDSINISQNQNWQYSFGSFSGNMTIQINCSNNNVSDSESYIYHIDNVKPVILYNFTNWANITQDETINFYHNVTDNNLFGGWIYIYEGTTLRTNLTATNLINSLYENTTELITDNLGNYTINLTYYDSHTLNNIPDFEILNGKIDSLEFFNQSVEFIKQNDRYNFVFSNLEIGKEIEIVFKIYSNSIFLLENSKYSFHIVDWQNKRWIDFETDNAEELEFERINYNTFKLKFKPNKEIVTFSSFGILNVESLLLHYIVIEEIDLNTQLLQDIKDILEDSKQEQIELNRGFNMIWFWLIFIFAIVFPFSVRDRTLRPLAYTVSIIMFMICLGIINFIDFGLSGVLIFAINIFCVVFPYIYVKQLAL